MIVEPSILPLLLGAGAVAMCGTLALLGAPALRRRARVLLALVLALTFGRDPLRAVAAATPA